jgi:diacylglycerol O-acyltransferase / wax synthase
MRVPRSEGKAVGGTAVGRRRQPPDRLTAPDLMFLWPEDEGWPQDIGALAILDGRRLWDGSGPFPIQAMREHVAGRLHLFPRFRQRLYRPPFGLGWPLWVDDPAFDIAAHVGVLPVPAPGNEGELLRTCERLRRRQLRHSRPLWEMWFLPGLPEERVGLFIKLHHAVADGVAGIAALGAFVDPMPDAPAMLPRRWHPQPRPSDRELFIDNLRRRLKELHRALAALASPVDTLRRMKRAWPAAREVFAEGMAPRTSLNRRIGSDRRLAIIRSSLGTAKAIAHVHGAKVNDVLLTALAAGFADLLRSRGERTENLVLRAFVPISLHRERPGQARGNLDAGMAVPMPLGERDHVRRLHVIAAETTERKKWARPPAGTYFRSGPLQRAFLRLMPYQRFMNAYVANVPGPPQGFYFKGSPILELFPLVPITANISIGAGALSYAGQFNLTVVADRELCQDLDVFVEGVRRSLDALEATLLPTTASA